MFKVGQKVVCVRGGPWDPKSGYGDEIFPVERAVYTVRRIEMRAHPDGEQLCVLLEEITNRVRMYAGCTEAYEPSFRVARFRPAVEPSTDISIFTQILDDVNAGRVREIA
jgi:hypothetical protein